ncbi:outer membrane beta-barrel protein [Lichenihabitans sp. Uapishka_5]|uniref:outer membrane protein n=1 Tax=Lichenihabitans sp. Uapishka_5 TaxID=3037302 RepID=UPI0029E82097|nr:outer membrane beta-barrel protein [Lichenihabitans sp. Uapishka_5]MDX7950079.1 outer membrane beta-barrel protein [Lichenihabitans sp. Uapishka_5]
MFKRIVLSTTALVATVAAASAADLPMRSAPPAPYYAAPVYSWTGFYVGANLGGAFDNKSGALSPNGFSAPLATSSSDSDSGFIGGGQAGYNWQNGTFVYGVETDIDYINLGGSGSTSTSSTNFNSATLTTRREDGDGFLGTLRGRLGYAGFDRTLLYVTGGLAYGDFGSRYTGATFTNAQGLTTATYGVSGNDDVRVGWTIGAGLEYAITPNISVKGEYLYADLGRKNYTLIGTSAGTQGTSFNAHSDGSTSIARVGLNYKFTSY